MTPNDYDIQIETEKVTIYKLKNFPITVSVPKSGFKPFLFWWLETTKKGEKNIFKSITELDGMSLEEVSEELINMIILKYSSFF